MIATVQEKEMNAECYMHAWGLTQDRVTERIQEASNVCKDKRESKNEKG